MNEKAGQSRQKSRKARKPTFKTKQQSRQRKMKFTLKHNLVFVVTASMRNMILPR